MNALESPQAGPSFEKFPPATMIVVGPTLTGLPYVRSTDQRSPLALTNTALNMQNAESGVSVRVGEHFLLDLGERDWQVRIGNRGIVTDVTDAQAPEASHGYFQAIKAGKTKLYATSDPPPLESSPPTLQPTLFLEIQVTVLP